MKRVLITLTLIAASLIAVPAMAQSAGNATPKQAMSKAITDMDNGIANNDMETANTEFHKAISLFMDDMNGITQQMNASSNKDEKAQLAAKLEQKKALYKDIKFLSLKMTDNRVALQQKLTTAMNGM